MKILRSIVLLAMLTSPTVHAQALYPMATQLQTSRFQQVLRELRCLVCQNQDLSDSNAELAKDLRKQVYTLVRAGKDEAAIKNYLTTRYGDFILFKPPLKGTTWFLWFGPFLFLLVGLAMYWCTCIRRVG